MSDGGVEGGCFLGVGEMGTWVGIEDVYVYRKRSGRLYCGSKRSELGVFRCFPGCWLGLALEKLGEHVCLVSGVCWIMRLRLCGVGGCIGLRSRAIRFDGRKDGIIICIR